MTLEDVMDNETRVAGAAQARTVPGPTGGALEAERADDALSQGIYALMAHVIQTMFEVLGYGDHQQDQKLRLNSMIRKAMSDQTGQSLRQDIARAQQAGAAQAGTLTDKQILTILWKYSSLVSVGNYSSTAFDCQEDTINFAASASPAAQEDTARLDWLAHHGAALRVDGKQWYIDAPYHTGIADVDDRVRFSTARAAIDAAIAKNKGAASASPAAQEDARDAERYRWLRDKSEPAICAFYLSVGKAFDGVKFNRATVDEAIDAQIDASIAKTK